MHEWYLKVFFIVSCLWSTLMSGLSFLQVANRIHLNKVCRSIDWWVAGVHFILLQPISRCKTSEKAFSRQKTRFFFNPHRATIWSLYVPPSLIVKTRPFPYQGGWRVDKTSPPPFALVWVRGVTGVVGVAEPLKGFRSTSDWIQTFQCLLLRIICPHPPPPSLTAQAPPDLPLAIWGQLRGN